MPQTEKDSERYAYQSLIAHLSEADQPARIFELVDKRGFLASQADYFEDFGRTSADVESFLLPAAMAAEDWNRFLRYAVIALNLRGMAEDLAEPEILIALTRSGRGKLAEDSASRIPDPLRRAAARSVIAAEQRRADSLFQQQLEAVAHDLEAPLAPAVDGEEISQRSELLATMARRLGVDHHGSWTAWIDKAGLSEEQASPVWRAVTEAWLDRGDPEAPELWEAVGKIQGTEKLLDFLPARFAELKIIDPDILLKRLGGLFRNEDDRHRAVTLFLSRLATRHREVAISAWETWVGGQTVRWTPSLIEAGRALFASFEPWQRARLMVELHEPASRVALAMMVLEIEGGEGNRREVLGAIEGIPDGPERLHWTLRYLKACCRCKGTEIRNQTAAVGRYLHDLRYDAHDRELRIYLDLVAFFFPESLPGQMESVVLAPTCRDTTLLHLATAAEELNLAEQILKNCPSYAKLVSQSESEGFQLRRELLHRSASRVCSLSGNLPTSLPPLLREEEDALRAMLASGSEIPTETALQACAGIRDRRLELLTRLRISRTQNVPVTLDPSTLYASLAHLHPLEDEALALTCLLDPTPDPRSHLKAIHSLRSPSHRVLTLLHFGWSLLEDQAAQHRLSWDPCEVIEMIRPELMIEGSEDLAALLPEIAALGAQAGGESAVTEVCEAVEIAATLMEAPWPLRREAILSLVSRIPSIFRTLAHPSRARIQRSSRDALVAIALLPVTLEPGPASEELSSHWHEILPAIAAIASRLSESEREAVQRAMSQGLPRGDSTRMANLIYSACFAAPGDRFRTAARLLREHEPSSSELCAFVYLLAQQFPSLAATLVARLPPGLERERLALQVIRQGWLPSGQAGHLLEHVREESRSELEAWASIDLPGSDVFWVQGLAHLISRCGLSSDSPDHVNLVRRLWVVWPSASRFEIASALQPALRSGGRPYGEAVLRFWFHSQLSPKRQTFSTEELPPVLEALSAGSSIEALKDRKPQEPEMSDDTDRSRREREVYAQMRSGPRRGETALWRSSLPRPWILCLAFGSLLALMFLEPSIYWEYLPRLFGPQQWPPQIPDKILGLFLLCALVLPVKGWLTNAYIARRSPHDRERPAWIKLLRGVMGSFPTGGLLAISWWKSVLAREPPWARPRHRPMLHLTLDASSGRLTEPAIRYPATSLVAVTVTVLSFFPFYALPFVLTSPEQGLDKPTLVLLCGGLHIVLFLCIGIEAREALRRNPGAPLKRGLRWIFWASCLLPFPLCAGLFFLHSQGSRRSTLVSTARDRRGSSEKLTFRLRRKLQLAGENAPWMARWTFPNRSGKMEDVGSAEGERASLYRLKTLLLGPEAALLAGLLASTGALPGPCVSECTVVRLLYASLACGVAMLPLQYLAPLARSLRLARFAETATPWTSDGYLLMTPAVLLAGIGTGIYAAAGEVIKLGLLLMVGGPGVVTLFAALSMIDSLISKPPARRPRGWLWATLFTFIGMLGITLIAYPEHAPRALALVYAAPFASMIAGVALVPYLLHPFHPHQLRDRCLPRGLRALLLTCATTAVLPLGGLAVPFWIWARHRLWPRYEHLAHG